MPFISTKAIRNQNGILVFADTDTEISILFNYLKSGKNTETFLEDYPKVKLNQIDDVLEFAEEQLKSSLR